MSEIEGHPLLENMNASQKDAILHVDGPVLILAGAGSGKTRVITHRIAWLIREKEVSPDRILAVTFTNKAAREMKERVSHLLKGKAVGLWVTTFHSMGARILRKHSAALGFEKGFSIYDTSDQKSLAKRVLKEVNLDEKRYTPVMCLEQVSKWKGKCLRPQDLDSRHGDKNTIRFYERYQEELKKSQAMDFDDLLFHLIWLFRENLPILEIYQNQFLHLMVDEYQDTNPIQYELVRMLSKKHENVCVVGDEDQSIYSWRGADIQNILDFRKDYAKENSLVKRFELNMNYRCPKICLEAANHLIRNNTQRTSDKKSLVAFKGGEDLIAYHLANDAHDEANNLIMEMKRLNQEGEDWGSMVVLYRTHAQSRVIEQEMIRHGVPYQIFGGARFFERKEIKDILAYLSLVSNPFDTESLLRVINVPPRKIGDVSIDKLLTFSQNHGIPPLLAMDGIDTVSASVRGSLLSFYQMILKMRDFLQSGKNLVEITSWLLSEVQYVEWLKSKDENDRVENIQEFLSTLAEYEEGEENPTLQGFLEKAALIAAIDNFDQKASAITMMTLHNAKGLEFDYVFIVGMEEGLFPHQNSLENPASVEEERRLCYVGITRTMKELFLSSARIRFLNGRESYQIPSRFLREIGDNFLVRV